MPTPLEVLDTTELPGFLRVNPAGDGRNVFVSTPKGFQIFDAGTWSEPHGDHSHSYVQAPALSDTVYAGKEPGHVVAHEGKTVLFSDGDGRIQTVSTEDLRDGDHPEAETAEADEPHHGVAVAMPGGKMLETTGDADTRNGAKVVDADGTEIASTEECPGVHGEALVLGTDGALHVIDPASGEETDAIEVVDECREPTEWQDARPTVFTLGDSVYVSEPEKKSLHVVDLTSGEVTETVELPHAPNELTGVSGDVN